MKEATTKEQAAMSYGDKPNAGARALHTSHAERSALHAEPESLRAKK